MFLLSNKLARNIIVLASGSALAQVINFLASPIITRLYGPEVFGTFGTFTSIISLFIHLATLSIPLTIVLEKTQDSAIRVASVCLKVCQVSLPIILILTILSSYGIESLSSFFDGYLLMLLMVTLIINCLVDIATYFCIRNENFKVQSKSLLLKAVSISVCKICFGLVLPTLEILIISLILGTLAQLWLIEKHTPIKEILVKSIHVKYRDVNVVCSKYQQIVMFRTGQNMLTGLNATLPLIFINWKYGSIYAGYYVLTKTIMYLPITIIGKAVHDVFYKNISSAVSKSQPVFRKLLLSTFALLSLCVVPITILVLYGELIFSFAFGAGWSKSGSYAVLLSPWFILNFINRPYISTISVFKLEKVLFYNSCANFILICICFKVAISSSLNDEQYLLLLGLFMSVPQLIIMLLSSIKAFKYDRLNLK
ncbi:oligosaccharide flippase family protein [Vibrio crassostreae]|uniref:lipopolysaccharide biosynthesis protein n=1 Tax=Vibrio crassostreae TaxID=246167 RepID=UPI00200B5657|nr:oligosaccharide flippase family protein [Vibrio crassostreae]UPR28437.1 oligosaccharide flippase family protein [Vibrio crassostreae]